MKSRYTTAKPHITNVVPNSSLDTIAPRKRSNGVACKMRQPQAVCAIREFDHLLIQYVSLYVTSHPWESLHAREMGFDMPPVDVLVWPAAHLHTSCGPFCLP